MRSHVKIVFVAMMLLLIGGCTGYGTYMISSEAAAPTNAKDIKVYAITQPSGEYLVLGYVSVYDVNAQDAGNELKNKLKERAAMIGANAIIAFKLNLESTGGGGAEGIAIRYK